MRRQGVSFALNYSRCRQTECDRIYRPFLYECPIEDPSQVIIGALLSCLVHIVVQTEQMVKYTRFNSEWRVRGVKERHGAFELIQILMQLA